ncbi:MAG TPA: hypothetical protein VK210_02170 [Terriglobia bacterium]|nr:hypothetical protein [Terriglobia bacterium]
MALKLTKRRQAIALAAILLIAVIAWWFVAWESEEAAAPGVRGTYSTNFSVIEDPLSEGGNWINGRKDGLDWADVRTGSGIAFGTQSGLGGYDDSTAVLGGAWGPTQTVTATIHAKNQPSSNTVFEEVELRLRTTITAHRLTGYEVNFSCSANPANHYAQIVRWNGKLGSFSYLKATTMYHCSDGDIVKATMSGKTIEVFVNNVQIMKARDGTFSNGNPGIGFFLRGASGQVNPDFGFSSFTATDGFKPESNPSP